MWRGGIIGLGPNGKAHLQVLLTFPEVKIEAVSDIKREVTEEIEKNFGIRGFSDYRSLLKLNLDFIYICTPNDLHQEMVIETARSGVKAIFCEKPIALTLEDADEVISEVKKTKTKVLVNYSFPFTPEIKKITEIFKQGDLGELVFCWSRRFKGANFFMQKSTGPWMKKSASWGGWLIHHTTHDLEWMSRIGGRVKELYGKTFTTNPDPLAIESTWAIITFEKVGIGIVGDTLDGMADQSMGIQGRKGCIILDKENKVRIRSEGMERFEELELVIKGERNKYLLSARHFLRIMEKGIKPVVGLEEAKEALRLALAIRSSAREKRIIRLNEFSAEGKQG
ncbi:MAG: Gfo/Idh/MocA family oxidoreductase [Candidatus Omnitrophica bacterium]|nr:Gfo/Idh/MocA family oxidoreductase [Candidatus Omnitrophota bacterium]